MPTPNYPGASASKKGDPTHRSTPPSSTSFSDSPAALVRRTCSRLLTHWRSLQRIEPSCFPLIGFLTGSPLGGIGTSNGSSYWIPFPAWPPNLIGPAGCAPARYSTAFSRFMTRIARSQAGLGLASFSDPVLRQASFGAKDSSRISTIDCATPNSSGSTAPRLRPAGKDLFHCGGTQPAGKTQRGRLHPEAPRRPR